MLKERAGIWIKAAGQGVGKVGGSRKGIEEEGRACSPQGQVAAHIPCQMGAPQEGQRHLSL